MRGLLLVTLWAVLCVAVLADSGSALGCDKEKFQSESASILQACDFQTYLKPSYPKITPPLALAMLCLLYGVAFFVGRCCCNCCGGREPTQGLLCVATGTNRFYSRNMVVAVKISCILGFALVAVGSYFCLHKYDDILTMPQLVIDAGRRQIQNAVSSALSAQASVRELRTYVNRVATNVNDTRLTFVDGPLNDLTTSTDVLKEKNYFIALQATVNKWIGRVKVIWFTLISLLLFVLFLGLLVSACGNHRGNFLYCLIMILFVLTAVFFCVMGLTQIAIILSQDVCSDLRLATEGQNTTISDVLDCRNINNLSQAMTAAAVSIEHTEAVKMCYLLTDPKYGLFTMGYTGPDVDCRDGAALYGRVSDSASVARISVRECFNCSISTCSSKCTNQAIQISSIAYQSLDSDIRGAIASLSQSAGNVNCSLLLQAGARDVYGECKRFQSAVNQFFIGTILLSVGSLLTLTAYVLGAKRFIRLIETSEGHDMKVATARKSKIRAVGVFAAHMEKEQERLQQEREEKRHERGRKTRSATQPPPTLDLEAQHDAESRAKSMSELKLYEKESSLGRSVPELSNSQSMESPVHRQSSVLNIMGDDPLQRQRPQNPLKIDARSHSPVLKAKESVRRKPQIS